MLVSQTQFKSIFRCRQNHFIYEWVKWYISWCMTASTGTMFTTNIVFWLLVRINVQNTESLFGENIYRYTDCKTRVLTEKPTGPQLVKKFPALYGILKFITTFTRACHKPLSWARSTQYMPPPSHFLKIHVNISLLILPLTLTSSKLFLSLGSHQQNPVRTSPASHTCGMPRPSLSSLLDHPHNIWWGVKV